VEGTSAHRRMSRSANKSEATSGRHSRSGKGMPAHRNKSHCRRKFLEDSSGRRRSRSRSAHMSRKNKSRCRSRSWPRNKSSASVEVASGRSCGSAAAASTHVSGFCVFHISHVWNSTVHCYSLQHNWTNM